MSYFNNKAILVTGSTRGIGRAIAEILIREGATVGIHGRDIDKVKSVCSELSNMTDQKGAIPLAYDLSSPNTAISLVQDFIDSTGKLDGLVNNAGNGKAKAFRSITFEKWRDTFKLNLEATAFLSREAYLIMRKQRSGSIVNIASLAAHGPGKWMGADYAASKAGLISITKSLAFEAARFGIRVNAVSPGMIETDMTAGIPDSTKENLNIPMQRFGQPEEVASAVAFLLSNKSNYVTGQVLHVNGGLLI